MIIYGKNPIREAIYAKRPIYNLFIDKNFNDVKFIDFLKDRNIEYKTRDKGYLNEITENALHQGIVADVKEYETYMLENVIKSKKVITLLILDELNDPHNLGAIMRTAEATNLDGIIISNKNQVSLNATVAKVSSGAIEHVKVIIVGNINQTINKLKENNILVIGTDGNTDNEFMDIDDNKSVAFVLGNEGIGIRSLVKKNCDILVKIPMSGKVNSLNVSVAASIIMYRRYLKK